MTYHLLAFAGIPMLIFGICAALKQVIRIATEHEGEWWGGMPLVFACLVPGFLLGCFGSLFIGAFALTGMPQ